MVSIPFIDRRLATQRGAARIVFAYFHTLTGAKCRMNRWFPFGASFYHYQLTGRDMLGNSAAVTSLSEQNTPAPSTPPIRRPVLFYMAVIVAFGFLGAVVLVLLL
jgi:hypothetical protein